MSDVNKVTSVLGVDPNQNEAYQLLKVLGLEPIINWLLTYDVDISKDPLVNNVVWNQVPRVVRSSVGSNTNAFNLFCLTYTWRVHTHNSVNVTDITIVVRQSKPLIPIRQSLPNMEGRLVIRKYYNPTQINQSSAVGYANRIIAGGDTICVITADIEE